jgi:peptidoglycan/LPS O-acetylase OafA/YrhL
MSGQENHLAGGGEYRFFGAFRAVLALLVLTSHSSAWLPLWVSPLALGNVGVLSFFVLSGFVIAEACDVFYRGKPQRFLLNRFLRIYPTYWAACGIALAIYVWIPHPEFVANTYSIFANMSIILAERLPSSEFRLISVIWAVGIELRFYVIAALVDYVDRLLSHRQILRPGQVMFVAGGVFLVLYMYAWTTDFNRFTIIRMAPFFVLGFVYYRWFRYRSTGSLLLGFFALVATVHSYVVYNSADSGAYVFNSTLLFGLFLVFFACLAFVSRVPKVLQKIDKKLGALTYSIYLVHSPIVYVVSKSDIQGYYAFFIVLICSVSLSVFIFLLVEVPILKFRDSIRRVRLYS